METDKETVKEIPYNEMVKYKWLPKAVSTTEKVINLRKFFEVVKPDLLGSG